MILICLKNKHMAHNHLLN